VKLYIAAVQALTKKHRMELSLPPKLVEKQVWVPVISFCKIFIPSYAFDALLCRNWPFSSPNRLTLQITLLSNPHCGILVSFRGFLEDYFFLWGVGDGEGIHHLCS
jgi:hypothetical protein